MLHRVIDHHVGVPRLVGRDVHTGDVLVVACHPLQSGIPPFHDKPDVGVEGGSLGVDVHMERDDVKSQDNSSTWTVIQRQH